MNFGGKYRLQSEMGSLYRASFASTSPQSILIQSILILTLLNPRDVFSVLKSMSVTVVPPFSGNCCHPDQFSEARRMAESGSKSTTTKWFDVTILEEESTLPTRWLLLEEAKRWKNYTGRSHETEGSIAVRKQGEY